MYCTCIILAVKGRVKDRVKDRGEAINHKVALTSQVMMTMINKMNQGRGIKEEKEEKWKR